MKVHIVLMVTQCKEAASSEEEMRTKRESWKMQAQEHLALLALSVASFARSNIGRVSLDMSISAKTAVDKTHNS